MADEKKSGNWFTNWFLKKAVWFLITGVGVIFTMVLAYWKMAKQAAELAKLKHEKDVAEEDKKRQTLFERVASNERQASEAKAKVTDLKQQIQVLDTKIAEVQTKYQISKERVDALKDWADYDAFLSSTSGSGSDVPPGTTP